MILFWMACVESLEGNHSPPIFSNPEITNFVVLCETEEEFWTFTLETNAWTGNALLWLRDEQGVQEEHPIISQGAQRDGSSDSLEIELAIVADWRDAQRGKSTRWACEEQETLSILVEVYHPKTYSPTDCLFTGPEWPEESAPCCQSVGLALDPKVH